MMQRPFTLALLGNPNSGKSSLFNLLTGLRQKVANFPGVTVDVKVGRMSLAGTAVRVVDLPGAYSLYPNADDERVVLNVLANPNDPNYPDGVVYVADLTNLEKHLLLLTQIRDLGLPVVLALNMADIAEREGLVIDEEKLARRLGVPVVRISARDGFQVDRLRALLERMVREPDAFRAERPFYPLTPKEQAVVRRMQREVVPEREEAPYRLLLWAHHLHELPFLSEEQRRAAAAIVAEEGFQPLRHQIEETMARYDAFLPLIREVVRKAGSGENSLTDRLDAVLTHRVAGPVIFFAIMFVVFQAIYAWAELPMGWIETFFAELSAGMKRHLPQGWVTDLLTDGVVAGLGGILVFIPQIAILFFLISILEEIGYMARVVYLFDRVLQVFGLNGRSIVALISGGACAIPAIMSTRTISNWKERLITILVTPFISCSARIPVYAVLVGFVVPSDAYWGPFNAQGLAFMGLYLLGIMAALLAALVFKYVLQGRGSSFLLLELPVYRPPHWRNVLLTVYEKVRAFVWEAGRIIMVISIVLWFLASYGPPGALAEAEQQALTEAAARNLSEAERENLVAARKIQASWAGHLGKAIEPAIAPLGFDWKIGIALITSFAAREVFVGTMATIYSIGSTDDELTIRQYMARDLRPDGTPVFSVATAMSLLLFYVFAMQCMSTMAVVRRETGSWKWPLIQFVFMTGLAYLASFTAYHLLK